MLNQIETILWIMKAGYSTNNKGFSVLPARNPVLLNHLVSKKAFEKR